MSCLFPRLRRSSAMRPHKSITSSRAFADVALRTNSTDAQSPDHLLQTLLAEDMMTTADYVEVDLSDGRRVQAKKLIGGNRFIWVDPKKLERLSDLTSQDVEALEAAWQAQVINRCSRPRRKRVASGSANEDRYATAPHACQVMAGQYGANKGKKRKYADVVPSPQAATLNVPMVRPVELLKKPIRLTEMQRSHARRVLRMLAGDASQWCEHVLGLLLSRAIDPFELILGFRETNSTFQHDLRVCYEGHQYGSMDSDHCRNVWYNAAITQAFTCAGGEGGEEPVQRVLEIGPGAMGTLTRMMLSVPSDPPVSIFAVEAVQSSYLRVRELMQAHAEQFRVVHAVVGEAELTWPWENDAAPQAVVSELIGNLASSEGAVGIFRAMGRLNPELRTSLKVAIPKDFGTMLVPVDLSRTHQRLDYLLIENNVAIVNCFPFTETELVPCMEHQFMELYSTLDEVRGVNGTNPSVCDAVFTIRRRGLCHALACYVVYGDRDVQPWQHSNTSLVGASSNWWNVLVPVGKGQLWCEAGDMLYVTSTCDVNTFKPKYRLEVTLRRENKTLAKEVVNFDYHNLMPVRKVYKQLRQQRSSGTRSDTHAETSSLEHSVAPQT